LQGRLPLKKPYSCVQKYLQDYLFRLSFSLEGLFCNIDSVNEIYF
jgi:hypothetical protein